MGKKRDVLCQSHHQLIINFFHVSDKEHLYLCHLNLLATRLKQEIIIYIFNFLASCPNCKSIHITFLNCLKHGIKQSRSHFLVHIRIWISQIETETETCAEIQHWFKTKKVFCQTGICTGLENTGCVNISWLYHGLFNI